MESRNLEILVGDTKQGDNKAKNRHQDPLAIFVRMDYSARMAKTPDESLADAEHHQAQAIYHQRKALKAMEQYLNALDIGSLPRSHSIACIKTWQEYLAKNGPNTRKHITEATSTKFSERATSHTVMWDSSINPNDDSAFPPNTICRIRSKHLDGTRGAPPVIYFLWSQRWDVYPEFGVGPNAASRPATDQVDEAAVADPEAHAAISEIEEEFLTSKDEEEWAEYLETQPVDNQEAGEPEPTEEVDVSTHQYPTLDAWNAAHAAYFDALVVADAKPTDAQKTFLLATLPGHTNGPAALATAYQAAVLRSRNPTGVLGVIQPPPAEDPAKPWEDVEFDWDAAEEGMSDG